MGLDRLRDLRRRHVHHQDLARLGPDDGLGRCWLLSGVMSFVLWQLVWWNKYLGIGSVLLRSSWFGDCFYGITITV